MPFYMIANDGNIMEHAVPFDGTMDLYNTGNLLDSKGAAPDPGDRGALRHHRRLQQGQPAGIQPGDKLYFVNVLEHTTGQVVGRKVPLADILSEAYMPEIKVNSNGTTQWDKGDPGVSKFLELRVQAYSGTDLSMDPRNYLPPNGATPAGLTMIPLTIHSDNGRQRPAELQNMRHRTFTFARGGTDAVPLDHQDGRRIAAHPGAGVQHGSPAGFGDSCSFPPAPRRRATPGPARWRSGRSTAAAAGTIRSTSTSRRGSSSRAAGKRRPEWEKWARKDLYRIGPDADSTLPVKMAIHFREFAGTYMEHCHNTQHEDHAMLLRWDIEHPGQFMTMATPLPTWDGVQYVDSAALPTFRTVLLSQSPIDNATPGSTVTITATTFGLAAPLEYQFLDRSYPDGTWTETQAYSSNNVYAWNTTGYTNGAYETKVNVRNASTGESVGMGIIPSTLTSSVATGVTLHPRRPGQSAGAGGIGPVDGGCQRRVGELPVPVLAVQRDLVVASAKPYGATNDNTWTWDTTGLATGNYLVEVSARSAAPRRGAEAFYGGYSPTCSGLRLAATGGDALTPYRRARRLPGAVGPVDGRCQRRVGELPVPVLAVRRDLLVHRRSRTARRTTTPGPGTPPGWPPGTTRWRYGRTNAGSSAACGSYSRILPTSFGRRTPATGGDAHSAAVARQPADGGSHRSCGRPLPAAGRGATSTSSGCTTGRPGPSRKPYGATETTPGPGTPTRG